MTATPVPRWTVLSSLALSVAGLGVAGYLTVEHYTAGTTLACPDTGVINCQKVTSSAESVIAGIPVAVLGVVFFAAMLALTVPAAWRSPSAWLGRARLASVAIGVVSVVYLVYLELLVVDAICLWCTTVHVLTVALFAVVAIAAAAEPTSRRTSR
jgi:uncharacterized membrane protein